MFLLSVDQKYHGILRSPSTYSTSLLSYSSKMDIPRPSMSQVYLNMYDYG